MEPKVDPLLARVVTQVGIVHNDFAIGPGFEDQLRGGEVTREKQIELTWIFRDVEDVKYLDPVRYTRIQLHQEGQNDEFWYDANCGYEEDDVNIIRPHLVTNIGRWRRVDFHDEHARGMVRQLRKELVKAGALPSDD